LFGTFDPPHRSHAVIAEYMRDHADLDEVWWVVTPQNPFKRDQIVSDDRQRLAMAQLAVQGLKNVRVCDEELKLPTPSYTVDALAHFRAKWPEHEFLLIIGSDNLATFDRWKDPAGILRHHDVLVYPRPGHLLHLNEAQYRGHPRVKMMNAPLMDVSSTRIRQTLRQGGSVDQWVTAPVLEHIRREKLYTA
jgi:nicotinate-nucleotide adenylyltransferase